MNAAEILAELPRLNAAELAVVQAKLDEITGETWHANAELPDTDKHALDAALAEHHANPQAGSNWEDVEARIRGKFRQ